MRAPLSHAIDRWIPYVVSLLNIGAALGRRLGWGPPVPDWQSDVTIIVLAVGFFLAGHVRLHHPLRCEWCFRRVRR